MIRVFSKKKSSSFMVVIYLPIFDLKINCQVLEVPAVVLEFI